MLAMSRARLGSLRSRLASVSVRSSLARSSQQPAQACLLCRQARLFSNEESTTNSSDFMRNIMRLAKEKRKAPRQSQGQKGGNRPRIADLVKAGRQEAQQPQKAGTKQNGQQQQQQQQHASRKPKAQHNHKGKQHPQKHGQRAHKSKPAATSAATKQQASQSKKAAAAAAPKQKAAEPKKPSLPREPRPPVVTIMGHVDHGKTTLLDAFRQSSVAAQEAGGITQHIGAFSVPLLEGNTITFLDTPGHEAFSAMRARGASATDIVVLVVAADDGVMPQTLESIRHAKGANVPIVVAINKCDRENAQPSRVKQELMQHNVNLEEFGGDVQAVEISALKRQNLDELKEAIMLQAELAELTAAPKATATGFVIESRTDKFRGQLATVVVRDGTLKKGDVIVADATFGRIKALMDDAGKQVKTAPPSTAVEVMGWKDLPDVGAQFTVAKNEKTARGIAEENESLKSLEVLEEMKEVTEERREQEQLERESQQQENTGRRRRRRIFVRRVKESELNAPDHPVYNVVVKTDVQGTTEAVKELIGGLPQDKVECSIVRLGVGPITESDVELAKSFDADLVTFGLGESKAESRMVQSAGLHYTAHTVIYKLLEELQDRMASKLPAEIELESTGMAEVLRVFKLTGKKSAVVAGLRVNKGSMLRKGVFRVLRNNDVVFEGPATTLKHGKEDIGSAAKGMECGLQLEDFDDYQEGDVIECLETKRVSPSLTD